MPSYFFLPFFFPLMCKWHCYNYMFALSLNCTKAIKQEFLKEIALGESFGYGNLTNFSPWVSERNATESCYLRIISLVLLALADDLELLSISYGWDVGF